jgi:hypothetical protein
MNSIIKNQDLYCLISDMTDMIRIVKSRNEPDSIKVSQIEEYQEIIRFAQEQIGKQVKKIKLIDRN